MAKRKTSLGSNIERRTATDALLDAAPATRKVKTLKKSRLACEIETSTIEAVRDAVYWVPELTVSGMVARGLELALEEAKKEHNRGRKFQPRKGKVPTGRPLSR